MSMKVKTHLIVTDVHDEYNVNWCGRLLDSNPIIENGKPIFVVVGNHHRTEINTIDINLLEKRAKEFTQPHGRGAVSQDTSRIYIKEIDGNEKLACIVTHRRIKTFAPMYDEVGYKD